MMPPDNDELPEDDFRYGMLLDQLEASRISHTEAPHLHMWLSDQASERLQQQAISTAIPIESMAEQIKICAMLEKSASVIAKQFDFLSQFSALDATLSQTFPSNGQQPTTDRKNSPSEWADFRERLATDSLLLVQIARQARETLKGMNAKKGRPAKAWRNVRFVELVIRLQQLQSCTREECPRLATSLWNIYLPDEEINDSDTAEMIIRRSQVGQLAQGQNATKSA